MPLQTLLNVWTGPRFDGFYYDKEGYYLQGSSHPAISGTDENIPSGTLVYNLPIGPGYTTPIQNTTFAYISQAATLTGSFTGYTNMNLQKSDPFIRANNDYGSTDYDMFKVLAGAGTVRLLVSEPKLTEYFYSYLEGQLSSPAISPSGYNGGPLNPSIMVDYLNLTGGAQQRWGSSFNTTVKMKEYDFEGSRSWYIEAVVGTSSFETIKGAYLVLDGNNTAGEGYAFLPSAPTTIVGDDIDVNLTSSNGSGGAYRAYYPPLVGQYTVQFVTSEADAAA